MSIKNNVVCMLFMNTKKSHSVTCPNPLYPAKCVQTEQALKSYLPISLMNKMSHDPSTLLTTVKAITSIRVKEPLK